MRYVWLQVVRFITWSRVRKDSSVSNRMVYIYCDFTRICSKGFWNVGLFKYWPNHVEFSTTYPFSNSVWLQNVCAARSLKCTILFERLSKQINGMFFRIIRFKNFWFLSCCSLQMYKKRFKKQLNTFDFASIWYTVVRLDAWSMTFIKYLAPPFDSNSIGSHTLQRTIISSFSFLPLKQEWMSPRVNLLERVRWACRRSRLFGNANIVTTFLEDILTIRLK